MIVELLVDDIIVLVPRVDELRGLFGFDSTSFCTSGMKGQTIIYHGEGLERPMNTMRG